MIRSKARLAAFPKINNNKKHGSKENNDNKLLKDLVGNHSLKLSGSDGPGNNTNNLNLSLINNDEIAREEESLHKPNILSLSFHPSSNAKKKRQQQQQQQRSSKKPYDVSALESEICETQTPWSASTSWAKEKERQKHWHEISERKLTPEEERDLRVIENREHIDPKRFYKSTGTGRKQGELPTRVHFGTVVVGAHEFYSARMTKRERKARIIDEVLADKEKMKYLRGKGRAFAMQGKIGKRVVDPAAKRRRRR